MTDRSKNVISLRESGMSMRLIGLNLGVSKQAVHQILKRNRPDLLGPLDPSPFKAKGSGYNRCVSCGQRCRGARCMDCSRYWDAQRCIDAGHFFHSVYGRAPSATDFNPSYARSRGREDAVRRFQSGQYPHITTIQRLFGSWSKYLEACGFEPNPVGAAGTQARRPYKEI